MTTNTSETRTREWGRWRTWGCALLGSAPLAVAVGAGLHGGTAHAVLAMVLTPVLVLVMVVLAGIVLVQLIARRGEIGPAWAIQGCLGSAIAVVAIFASVVVGVFFEERYLRDAKLWCESRAPAMESFRAQHGRYPRSVWELEAEGSVPWVVSTFDPMIVSTEDGYEFDLNTAFIDGWSYDSKLGTWSHYD